VTWLVFLSFCWSSLVGSAIQDLADRTEISPRQLDRVGAISVPMLITEDSSEGGGFQDGYVEVLTVAGIEAAHAAAQCDDPSRQIACAVKAAPSNPPGRCGAHRPNRSAAGDGRCDRPVQRRDGVEWGQAPRQVALDESLRELQSGTASIFSEFRGSCRLWLAERYDYRCSISGEFCGKIRKESFQLRSCPFREHLSQRWRGAGPIILWSGSCSPGKVAGMTFDDRHLLEGVGQHSGGQHAGHSTAKNHRLPAPTSRLAS
jgi:hypothetical protein